MTRLLAPRTLAAAAATLAVAFAAVGALHTPAGRQLMQRLGVPCPVDRASADQVTALRETGLRDLRGRVPAPAMTALGVELGRTTVEDVRAWQQRHAAACDAITRGYAYLRCRGVAADALGAAGPPVSELWFSFGPDGRLVGVDLYRRGLADAGEAQAWADARERLERTLGSPAQALGDASPQVLRASALRTARIEYRYADLVATLTAANLPHAGLAVREQYLVAR